MHSILVPTKFRKVTEEKHSSNNRNATIRTLKNGWKNSRSPNLFFKVSLTEQEQGNLVKNDASSHTTRHPMPKNVPVVMTSVFCLVFPRDEAHSVALSWQWTHFTGL
ncbi:hypothetical protein ElyMa_002010400 [Elysia marginata]|uniref:Uncharacterized protein n=1 Tax=Elysia marginata TaxID=1093978 RepID=A0AAV4F3T2_9GAST|nr:hypothetical protein ElyMa_002010400 [Elysia marginata]